MEPNHYDNRPTNVNELSNQLIVLHNILARKSTFWNALEMKLFYTVLAKIKTRDEKNTIRLKKADIVDVLGIDPRNSNKLRNQFVSVMKKSFVQFDGATEEEWEDGFLITDVKSTKTIIDVRLSDRFMPLLVELEKHFTSFYLDNIGHFKSKNSIILYQNLKSWFYRDSMVTHKKYSLLELKKMFEIKDDEYMVKRGKNNDRIVFDTYHFKLKTLDVAVKEINADPIKSGMKIGTVETVKHRGFVWGYDIEFTLVDKNGRIWQPDEWHKKPVDVVESFKPEPPENQTTIDDFL